MRKAIFSLVALPLLAVSHAASAVPVKLLAHHQVSSGGTLSTLIWKSGDAQGCPVPVPPAIYAAPCYNPDNGLWAEAATIAAAVEAAGEATWDWNPATGVLTGTGLFWTTSFISSNPNGSSVISDKVVDLVIDTVNDTTNAASYDCVEGNFLAGVGANGCLDIGTGFNFITDSSAVYNVGGDAHCMQRTIGGDDQDTGPPRGLSTLPQAGVCDATDGAFDLYTIDTDDTAAGGQLVLSNGIALNASGANYLVFTAVSEAVDDGPFDALQQVPLNIDVLANDGGFTDPVTVTVTTAATKGTTQVNGSPGNKAGISIDYTANAGATGADSFVYTIDDGTNSDTATVTLNILAFGANDDTASTTRNHATFNIVVGANDVGFQDPVTITIVSPPDQGGTAVAPAPGALATAAVAYTPATTAADTPTYTETFTYQVDDGVNPVGTATVTVTVNNTVPVANNVGLNISTMGSAPGSTTATFNAGTFAGNSLGNAPSTVTATAGATGTTSVDPVTRVVTYTPAATFFKGSDTFTYTITDADGETNTGTVTVTIPNAVPALADASITTTANTASAAKALTITAGNGSLAQHTLAVTTAAGHGTCALSGTSVTYTPDADYTGPDSCVVTITDENGAGDSDTGTISITVNAAGGGGGGGVSGAELPGGSALDLYGLALLGAALWLRRGRDGLGKGDATDRP